MPPLIRQQRVGAVCDQVLDAVRVPGQSRPEGKKLNWAVAGRLARRWAWRGRLTPRGPLACHAGPNRFGRQPHEAHPCLQDTMSAVCRLLLAWSTQCFLAFSGPSVMTAVSRTSCTSSKWPRAAVVRVRVGAGGAPGRPATNTSVSGVAEDSDAGAVHAGNCNGGTALSLPGVRGAPVGRRAASIRPRPVPPPRHRPPLPGAAPSSPAAWMSGELRSLKLQ